MISANGLTKKYGDFVAVNNISFTINKGEITGLLGPNGAGKTTTLRMLTGYFPPTSGEITIGQYRVSDNPIQVKFNIGYLPESAPMYSDMRVKDFLIFSGEMREMDTPLIQKRIRELADVCGISEIMHKNIGECSKGYKQRVGLAYAMLNDPEILILDEPTSGLDPNQIIEIRNVIKEIGTKKTVILSTHILSEVEATCDRIIIINKGNIIADGKTEAIKNSFKDKKGSAITLVLEGEDYPSLESVIKSIIGVLSVEKKAECGFTTARISASEADNTKSAILAKIVENNWKLHEIKQETQSLEAIFAELTKGE